MVPIRPIFLDRLHHRQPFRPHQRSAQARHDDPQPSLIRQIRPREDVLQPRKRPPRGGIPQRLQYLMRRHDVMKDIELDRKVHDASLHDNALPRRQ
jgi:hypothetical protein